MTEQSKHLIFLVCTLSVAACAAMPGPDAQRIEKPPKTVIIKVTATENCSNGADITTATAERSCPFGAKDPADVACQSPSDNDNSERRWIAWENDDDKEFTLEFPDGHPFVNTQGRCKLDIPDNTFTCHMSNNPPDYEYKYDVVFDTCRKDPKIYIVR